MMKRFDMRASLAVCFVAMALGVAQADTYVIGSGELSCGRLLFAASGVDPGKYRTMNTADGLFVNEHAQYQEWLMGFVTGFNSAHADLAQQIETIDLAGMDLWMRDWCNKHPTQPIFEGAIAFIDEMRTNTAAARR